MEISVNNISVVDNSGSLLSAIPKLQEWKTYKQIQTALTVAPGAILRGLCGSAGDATYWY